MNNSKSDAAVLSEGTAAKFESPMDFQTNVHENAAASSDIFISRKYVKKFSFRDSTAVTIGMVAAMYIILQVLIKAGAVSSMVQGLLVPICVYVLLAVSLNLTVGILGELSLGHAGFMCVGAFSSAFFTKLMAETIPNKGLRFAIALVIGALLAALAGILIGIPVLRLKGDYLAIVTLAFGEIISNVVNVLFIGIDDAGFHFSMKDSLSLGMADDGVILIKGAQGISGNPRVSTFTVGVVLIIISLLVILNLINSRSGRAIMSIRDNRIASESVGINITKYKMMAFSISAAIAGVAGVLYSHNLSVLQSKDFDYNMSIMVLVYVVLGGIGNIRGSIFSAIILTALPELLRGIGNYRMLIYAVVLIVMMLFNWAPASINFRKKYLSFGNKKSENKQS